MNLQKRLAAKIMRCSPKRIQLDHGQLTQIKEAITRADVRSLLKKRIIKQKPVQGISHGRFRATLRAHRKGRRQRAGSRKGCKNARTPRKERWVQKIRAQRSFLVRLYTGGHVSTPTYRQLYLKAKGGFFRSTRHLRVYIEEQGHITKK